MFKCEFRLNLLEYLSSDIVDKYVLLNLKMKKTDKPWLEGALEAGAFAPWLPGNRCVHLYFPQKFKLNTY